MMLMVMVIPPRRCSEGDPHHRSPEAADIKERNYTKERNYLKKENHLERNLPTAADKQEKEEL